jgi:hypothetical protein
MNPVTLIVGFIPLLLFTVLDARIPVADAATIGAVAAVIIAVVMARRGAPVLPIVQAVTLAIIAVIAFVGGPGAQSFLSGYGRGLASLVLAAFMLVTLPFAPFTARIARARVPREAWHSSRFISLNRRISAAWGLAVLVLGLAHLTSALVGSSVAPLSAKLIDWVPTIIAVVLVIWYTQRTITAARPGPAAATQPPSAY